MKIAGVRFRDNWRVYDFDATGTEIAVGDAVIVESDRGPGFARVVRLREGDALPETPRTGQEQKHQGNGQKPAAKAEEPEEEIEVEVETPASLAAAAARAAAGAAPASAGPAEDRPRPPKGHRKVVRKATTEDLQKAEKNNAREADAFKMCQDMVAERELDMKLIRAEYSFDASRVTFYFFSENRIDFRELVKDLAHKLHSRIEMRQVGVRDVARMIGGFGPCGRELCCTSHLRSFEPVSIRMAKKQEMVLNPAKISGVCGRLLCCLSYEFPMYDAIKKDLAEMKESVLREKQELQERKLAEERREAEERRAVDEKRRQEEEKKKQEQKQEQRQRDRQRQAVQQQQKQEKKKEGQQDQKQRQPQGQKQQRDRQQKQQQQPRQPQQQRRPEQQAPQPRPEGEQQPGEGQQQAERGESRGSKKRRFWRKKKKGGGGGQGGGAPQPGGAPAGGGA